MTVPIVIDLIHVLEVPLAAWSFFPEGDPAVEAWVAEKAFAVLGGDSSLVRGVDPSQGDDPRPRRRSTLERRHLRRLP